MTSPPIYTRARLGTADVFILLWRAKWLMALVFLPIFATGMLIAMSLPTEYVAQSRVFVSLSEEYVFRPRVGENVQNTVPDTEQLIQSEIELIRSPVISDRVLTELGIGTIYPKLVEAASTSTESDRYELAEAAVTLIDQNFVATAAPKASVIQASFTHPDAETASRVLNEILDAYIDYRSEIFADKSPVSLERQRVQFENDLRDVEEEMRAFLETNKLGDFETARLTTQALFTSVQEAILTNNTNRSELEAQLAVLRQQLEATPEEVDIFVEDSSSQSLVDLQLQREDLLTRYKPESQAVRDIDARIERSREFLNSREGNTGTIRRGPNPVYQQLQTTFNSVRSQLAAARQQSAVLARQAEDISKQQMSLATLSPQWQVLQRKRDLLEDNARNFATREVEARSLAEIADQGSDNIRILERARRPVEGSSMKMLAAIASLLFAGFCSLIAGMIWALTRKGFATPAALERTTGLPVVSTVRRHKAA